MGWFGHSVATFNFVTERFVWIHARIWHFSKRKQLRQKNTKRPNISFCVEHPEAKRFNCKPLQWQRILSTAKKNNFFWINFKLSRNFILNRFVFSLLPFYDTRLTCIEIAPNRNHKFSPHCHHRGEHFLLLNHHAILFVMPKIPFPVLLETPSKQDSSL